jgi:hypothetical protein
MPIACVPWARIVYIMESFTGDTRRVSRLLDDSRISVYEN